MQICSIYEFGTNYVLLMFPAALESKLRRGFFTARMRMPLIFAATGVQHPKIEKAAQLNSATLHLQWVVRKPAGTHSPVPGQVANIPKQGGTK